MYFVNIILKSAVIFWCMLSRSQCQSDYNFGSQVSLCLKTTLTRQPNKILSCNHWFCNCQHFYNWEMDLRWCKIFFHIQHPN